MPINFFENKCRTYSNQIEFGLCDDAPPSNNPAYIDENDKTKWIGIVENNSNKKVEFFAIDACINIRKPDGSIESRCDGLLSYENNLIFVELKCREGGQWLKKGREQLTITINNFKDNNTLADFGKVYAIVCNSLRPISHVGHASNMQKFYDETNLVLKSNNTITI